MWLLPYFSSRHSPPRQLSAQHNHQLITTASGKKALPGAIDGKVTPQLIPDATAYRVFFRAFTADADPARQQAMLKRANLSAADFAAALNAGARFQALRAAYIQQTQISGANQSALLAQQTAIYL